LKWKEGENPVRCALDGSFSDISHVTGSMERGRERAVFTVIHKSGIVEKRAAYQEGQARLEKMVEYREDLKAHGVPTVDAKMKNGVYVMPYIHGETGHTYLKKLLYKDVDLFLRRMDAFRDLILQSSEIAEPDQGDGEGAVLRKGYIDMVPLNSFYMNDTFVFYDQEFCEENYPANALIWRMVATFYAGDLEVQKLLPMDVLLERYDLKRRLEKWQKIEWDFLADLRQEKVLRKYHGKCRRNPDITNSNRQCLNYSSEQYQKLFINIFRNADTRKLILFGSGRFTKRFLELYRQDYPVYAVIDNSQEKWGQEIEGITIQSPKLLEQLQSGEYKVLICIKNYLSVMKQLIGMGVTEYSIFDSGRDYPRKRKPVQQSAEDRAEGSPALKKKYHVGYIAGVFDLFHVGHLNMFKRAKEQCDYLIVGVVTDEGVRKFKETDTFVPYEERAEMVRSCRYVDEVAEIPLNFGGTSDAWRLHHFDCQFSGSDYVDNPDWLAEKEFLEKHGAEMVFFPYTESTSSTKLKAMIERKLL
jgi:cytidyltransferase-like protein